MHKAIVTFPVALHPLTAPPDSFGYALPHPPFPTYVRSECSPDIHPTLLRSWAAATWRGAGTRVTPDGAYGELQSASEGLDVANKEAGAVQCGQMVLEPPTRRRSRMGGLRIISCGRDR